ncbi:interferon-induced protein 44-like [Clarias gariepinus]|uniref:interferon-induced protein 44-like n=1 Tax=Clarias gariepinus TaxID=13013 RepID=UPI00234D2D29|nr:interferon-induced protein 44-like [Clarias gariepinus]XP_053353035.1 interferon-induced protein 44-like [Clarias gariepinus]
MGSSPSKPEFDSVLAEKHVTSGADILLQCEANTEDVTASWQKDSRSLSCVHGKHSVSKRGTKFVLKISNAQESDEGNYTITLSNSSGSASCSALVRVEIKDWREVQWSKKDLLLKTLKSFEICNEVKELRYLVYGPVGAGKSSTINTIRSIFEGRQFVNCLAAAESTTSHTLCFESYRFANEEESFPFIFYDIMGAEAKENGVQTQDVISALKGHIKEGYMFNPDTPLSESNLYYNKNPSLSDQMHCLVYVVQAHRVSVMEQAFLNKLKSVRKTASRMGIPQVVFMTNVDRACPMTKENLRNIYKSKKIRENVIKYSHALGVPVNCIFPVLNYHEETHVNEDINCLMLDALTQIIHFANDYVKKFSKSKMSHQQPHC